MAMITRLSTTTAPGSPKALQRFQNCIAFLWPSLQTPSTSAARQLQPKSTQIDAIDCFTNELVHRKTKKWETFRDNLTRKKDAVVTVACDKDPTTTTTTTTSFSETVGIISKGVMTDIESLRSPPLGLDIRSLSQPQLDNLLMSTVEIKNKVDFLYLIRQCIDWQQLPSQPVLLSCLKYLSTLTRLNHIESIAEVCRKQNNDLVKVYADMAPFKAMAQWRSGGTDVALLTLQRGYAVESDEGRRMVRNAFRIIAEETLSQKSEAVLVALMEVARAIYTQHKDIFVVACVWKQCFASNWFCDQKTAADLFEHYQELRQLVGRRSNSLCSSFLGRHNVDAVHRLIEAFLQYHEKEPCANCLSQLFNYQYFRRDLRACAEIIKSCSELEMPLTELQNEQFLSLFLNQSEMATPVTTASKPPKPFKQFQYKF